MQLTTLARVKAHIGGFTTTASDDLLTSVIDSVSARFERYLWRTVAKQTYTEVLPARNAEKVFALSAVPITTVTTVKYETHPDYFASGTALDSKLWTYDANGGYLRLIMTTPYKPGFVQVAYVAGMATDTTDFIARFPDIAQQADVQVAYEYSRRNTPGGNATFGQGGTSHTGELDLLPTVTKALNMHRRVTV